MESVRLLLSLTQEFVILFAVKHQQVTTEKNKLIHNLVYTLSAMHDHANELFPNPSMHIQRTNNMPHCTVHVTTIN